MINLDYLCAKYGQEIGEKAEENILQKALGVLREDGVYAMFLWLEDKDKKKSVRTELTTLLNEKEIKKYLSQNSDFLEDLKQFCEKLREVAQDIDKLFFMKKILERTLTYALYHAKMKGEKNVAET